MRIVLGIFANRIDVRDAIDALQKERFNPKDVLGGITSLGVNEKDAKLYERQIKDGAILVAVPIVRGEAHIVMEIFDDYNAREIFVIAQERSARYRQHAERLFGGYIGIKGGHVRRNKGEK